jgi:hypothetical protein
MSTDAETAQCKFPGCDRQADVTVMPSGEEGVALCEEHRELLLSDPTEFRRLWGALEPRPQGRGPTFHPRRLDEGS